MKTLSLRPVVTSVLIASALSMLMSASSTARAIDPQDSGSEPAQVPSTDVSFSLVRANVDSNIHVLSVSKNGRDIELVQLGDGETIEIPVNLDSAAVRDSGLRPEEISEAREEAREALELTLRGLASDDFDGAMVVDANGQALTLEATKAGKPLPRENILKKVFAFNHELYKPMPKGLTTAAMLKRFVAMTWQFVFVETLHAGIDYYKQYRRVAPRLNEFGFAVDLKIEPQVFIAKFNPTQHFKLTSRSWAIFLEISYSAKRHRVMMHTRFRKEKGSGGFGMPGFKAEFKTFQSDGTTKPYRGKAWYPVSPPIISFVLDSSEHYFAQGVTVGFNTGDLVPGSTLTNTFTEFVQGQGDLDLVDVPHKATDALAKAANSAVELVAHANLRSGGVFNTSAYILHSRALMCANLFMGAY